MMDKQEVKKMLKYMHTTAEQKGTIDEDDFFNINLDVGTDLQENNVNDLIAFHEIEERAYNLCSDKENYIIMLRALGITFRTIGKKICYSGESIRNLYENALNKICK
ncbi:hypothetical protein J9174_07905 [Macrococcoides canis]|uniref:hypothetical protein n=1 Tax=Macrococcoides canis TaxID=1855823 RepID=UPI001AEC6162|nr:hypothetical protein [Macrococcus canis]QTQ07358.1 hypothetical protein J9174_07905 [Macrococcus canis]